MTTVLDNSVVIDWLLDREAKSGAAGMVRRHSVELRVPAVFWTELLYVLGKYVNRGQIDRPFRDRCLRDVRRLDPITDLEAAAPGPSFDRARLLGDQHGLTIYDSVYLELALRVGARLVTLDKQLAEAARSMGIEVVDA